MRGRRHCATTPPEQEFEDEGSLTRAARRVSDSRDLASARESAGRPAARVSVWGIQNQRPSRSRRPWQPVGASSPKKRILNH